MNVGLQRARVLGAVAAAVFLAAADPASAADTWTVEENHFSKGDWGTTIATDADGNIWVGTFNGDVGKFSPALQLIWHRRTRVYASVASLVVGPDDVVYVGGDTSNDLYVPNHGSWDVWIAKYRADGTLLGGAQTGGKNVDHMAGIAVDPGGDVVVAANYHGVLRRYDPTGVNLWSISLEAIGSNATISGVAIDRLGNIFATGRSEGVGPHQMWLNKYNGDGNLLWGRQLGSSAYDAPFGAVVDSQGSVYLSGFTNGSLFGPLLGYEDAWVAKYDAEGTFVWGTQLGTSGFSRVNGPCIGPDDHVYVTGKAGGPLFGGSDASLFAAEYAGDGTLVRSIQFGRKLDATYACAVAADGTLYISERVGAADQLALAKLTPIPAP